MTRSRILGIGRYLPERVVTNKDLEKFFDTSDEWIQQRTGIEERRYADEGVACSDLALEATKKAAENAGIEISDIEFIIFSTLSPDHHFPGSACYLQKKLGLPGIGCLDIRNQCTGFLYGLAVADAFVKVGMYKRILLVGAEVHSSSLDFTNRGRDVTVIFGDGAGAAIVGPSEDPERGILSSHLHADGRHTNALRLDIWDISKKPYLTEETLRQGLHYAQMKGKEVFKHAVTTIPKVIGEALEANDCSLDEVALVIPHQANLRINQFAAARLEYPQEKVFNNIQKYGNTTAASIPICLSEAQEQGRIQAGDLVLLVAFGAGFTWAATLMRW